MERVRARFCLAVGAIALAMAATALGAVAAPTRDITSDVMPAAARVQASPDATPNLDDEEHHDPTPPPSEDPGGDMASQEPMEMGGHTADPSPSAAPAHGHGAVPSPEPAASGGHGAMPGMDDQELASHEPSPGGHDEAAAGGHEDEEIAADRPRALVLGGFAAFNGIALAGAAVLRRRDRAAAALKARRTRSTQPEKDASR